MKTLTEEQKENLKFYIQKFKEFLDTSEGKEFKEEVEYKKKILSRLLAKDHILNLTEDEFVQVIKNLWSFNTMWGNVEFKANEIIKTNGIQKIRKELNNLLYGPEPLDIRIDNFRNNIKGLAVASISEILLFIFPDKYGIWNYVPAHALTFLKIDLLSGKIRSGDDWWKIKSGSDYLKCVEVFELIKNELKNSGLENANFIDAQSFLFFITRKIAKDSEKEEEPRSKKQEIQIVGTDSIKIEKIMKKVEDLTHTDIQGILIELGNLLGYDTYVADPSKTYNGRKLGELATLKDIPNFTYERIVETAKYIDVIWFKDEFPIFCFEIENTTGVTKGLLRLYQIRHMKDAKFFVIAPKDILAKFKLEINKDPFRTIKNRYIFRSYDSLVDIYNSSVAYYKKRDEFFNSE